MNRRLAFLIGQKQCSERFEGIFELVSQRMVSEDAFRERQLDFQEREMQERRKQRKLELKREVRAEAESR